MKQNKIKTLKATILGEKANSEPQILELAIELNHRNGLGKTYLIQHPKAKPTFPGKLLKLSISERNINEVLPTPFLLQSTIISAPLSDLSRNLNCGESLLGKIKDPADCTLINTVCDK